MNELTKKILERSIFKNIFDITVLPPGATCNYPLDLSRENTVAASWRGEELPPDLHYEGDELWLPTMKYAKAINTSHDETLLLQSHAAALDKVILRFLEQATNRQKCDINLSVPENFVLAFRKEFELSQDGILTGEFAMGILDINKTKVLKAPKKISQLSNPGRLSFVAVDEDGTVVSYVDIDKKYINKIRLDVIGRANSVFLEKMLTNIWSDADKEKAAAFAQSIKNSWKSNNE